MLLELAALLAKEFVALVEFPLRLDERAILLHRALVSGEQQVEHLPAPGRDRVLPPLDGDGQRLAVGVGGRRRAGEQRRDARKQMVGRIGLGQVKIRAGAQPLEDVLGLREGCEQDDRQGLQAGVPLERGAHRVTVHLGHVDVAHDELHVLVFEQRQRLEPAARNGRAVAVPFEHAPQHQRLGGAVLDHEDVRGVRHGKDVVRGAWCVSSLSPTREPQL